MVGNGRSTGWNFTPTKFNFFASSCPRKRDRASRKNWISNLGGDVRGAAVERDDRGCRENRTAGAREDLEDGSETGTPVRTDVAFFR